MMRNSFNERVTEQAAMYALGMLSQSEAWSFENCLDEGREDYVEEFATFDEVVGELGLGAVEQSPSESLRDRLRARIAVEGKSEEQGGIESGSASPSQQSLTVRLNEGKWRQFADGVFIKTLFVDRDRGTVTSLVKLEPGARFPQHRHLGIEQSLIIEGDCRVNDQVLTPGDYRCAEAGTIDTDLTTEHGTVFMIVAPKELEIMDPLWKN
jgi:anti-sigma factor ChrR (cupin superfamily)